MPTIYSEFSPPPAVDVDVSDPSLTVQSFADEADINWIMAKYSQDAFEANTSARTVRQGLLDPAAFADVSYVTNYQDALERIKNAEIAFMECPAKVRDRFDNDVGKMVEYLMDPDNAQYVDQDKIVDTAPIGNTA